MIQQRILLTGIILTTWTGIGMASGMGFFFLIAGYFTPGAYDRKGSKSFLLDRLVQLGIQLLIYDLLLDPLVVYIASGLHGSYWSFYGYYLLHERGLQMDQFGSSRRSYFSALSTVPGGC